MRKTKRGWEHGDTRKCKLYGVWKGMKKRCYDPKDKRFERYGGRGITVCDEWRYNYPNFKEWAVSHGYQPKLQIDRRNNDGNYSPDNCRFVTSLVNGQNRPKPATTKPDWVRQKAIDLFLDGEPLHIILAQTQMSNGTFYRIRNSYLRQLI